jgi:predicted Rossmann fold flavoprotein
MDHSDLVVVGGGAAGVFCAVNAARIHPGLRVTLIERTERLLAKVRVSGGGRCNVTHDCTDIEEMSRCYPRGGRFVRKAFHGFFTDDTVEWFGSRGLTLVTESDGRMFPSTNRSESVIACLMGEAERHGVRFLFHAEPTAVLPEADGFRLPLRDGRILTSRKVCVATGGFRKRAQLDWLSGLGHTIVDPVPSLFTFNLPGHPISALMGLSVPDAVVRMEGARQGHRGALLITHWGLSGPAVLKASAWQAREMHGADYRFPFQVQWLPEESHALVKTRFQDLRRERGAASVTARCPFGLPSRLWQFLAEASGVGAGVRWADLTSAQSELLASHLLRHGFRAEGQTVFKEEFVTAGGVSTAEVEPSSMESRRIPGLYFAGEVLDVDGITGGYNFQHAWTSGWMAAAHIARSLG